MQKVKNSFNVTFDLTLKIELIPGVQAKWDTRISFDFDLNVMTETDDETFKDKLTEVLETKHKGSLEKAARELIDIISERIETDSVKVTDVKNVKVTKRNPDNV